MKFIMVRSAVLLILASVIITSNGCSRKQEEYPKAELKFPGVSDWAIQKSSKDAAALISTLAGNLSKVTKFIPYGEFVTPVLSAVSVMASMLTAAKTELGKLVDESLGIQVVGDIQAKIVTVKNRLEEVEQALKQAQSFDTPIALAVQQCEEILQKFSQDWSYLYKSDNYMLSSPSLVSFAGVYAGVAGFRFDRSPDRRRHTIDEMKLLKKVVEMYRNATIEKRAGYLKINKDVWQRVVTISCEDRFFDVTACESCSKATCAVAGSSQNARDQSPSYNSFLNYDNELKRLYNGYFTEPVEALQKLIQTFEDKMKQ